MQAALANKVLGGRSKYERGPESRCLKANVGVRCKLKRNTEAVGVPRSHACRMSRPPRPSFRPLQMVESVVQSCAVCVTVCTTDVCEVIAGMDVFRRIYSIVGMQWVRFAVQVCASLCRFVPCFHVLAHDGWTVSALSASGFKFAAHSRDHLPGLVDMYEVAVQL